MAVTPKIANIVVSIEGESGFFFNRKMAITNIDIDNMIVKDDDSGLFKSEGLILKFIGEKIS